MTQSRKADHAIEPIFLERWSPRAFDASPMPEADLLRILEAARWAPSAYNIQPWRFLHARRGEDHWQGFVDLLNAFNRSWAQNASALVFLLSDKIMPGDGGDRPDAPSKYNSFDTGAAWAQMALQATALGYHAHAMAGILSDEIRSSLDVPDRYRIEVGVAIGRKADPSLLPAALQEREGPSPRFSLGDIAFAGGFPK